MAEGLKFVDQVVARFFDGAKKEQTKPKPSHAIAVRSKHFHQASATDVVIFFMLSTITIIALPVLAVVSTITRRRHRYRQPTFYKVDTPSFDSTGNFRKSLHRCSSELLGRIGLGLGFVSMVRFTVRFQASY